MKGYKVIDATGLACPRPVVMAKEAIDCHDKVLVIVGNETALENVKRLGAKLSCRSTVTKRGKENFEITLEKASTGELLPKDDCVVCGEVLPSTGPFVLVLSGDRMGFGDDTLGSVLMKSFLHTMTGQEMKPSTIILYNAGVRLAVSGSEVLDDLKALESAGTAVLVCGTCLDYFNIKDKLAVGSVSNMYDIAETMSNAGRLLRP